LVGGAHVRFLIRWRISILRARTSAFLLLALLLAPFPAIPAAEVPHSVKQMWADCNPRKDALETEVIREWKENGGVYRHVRFVVGTFKGKRARMTAIYGFATASQAKNEWLPAVMHIHGGGQRASLSEVKLLVARGYAALSINWGASSGQPPFNSVEGAEPGDPNAVWGAVDPSQLNVPGYNSLKPSWAGSPPTFVRLAWE
jgi:hypothetical protein